MRSGALLSASSVHDLYVHLPNLKLPMIRTEPSSGIAGACHAGAWR